MTPSTDRRRGAGHVEASVRAAGADGRPALAGFLTAGFPSRRGFAEVARRVAGAVDVLELGVPFSDPMADGVTIQEASRTALENGITLDWILDLVAGLELATPVVLMSYLNPLLTRSHATLAAEASAAGVDGFIVPDLPLEEADALRDALGGEKLALVQLATPLTPLARRQRLAAASGGFLYAVTRTGTTGAEGAPTGTENPPTVGREPSSRTRACHGSSVSSETKAYLDELRDLSSLPVLAGFGIRSPEQVRELAPHVDGLIVGSALIERLAADEDPVEFLDTLREAHRTSAASYDT